MPKDDQKEWPRISEICDKSRSGNVNAADYEDLFVKRGLAGNEDAATCLMRLVECDGSW